MFISDPSIRSVGHVFDTQCPSQFDTSVHCLSYPVLIEGPRYLQVPSGGLHDQRERVLTLTRITLQFYLLFLLFKISLDVRIKDTVGPGSVKVVGSG